MPRPIDHLVICVRVLAQAELNLRTLGFTLTPTGVHPFGTSFRLAMFGNNYLELLAVINAAAVPAATPGRFSFAAHHQRFLAAAERDVDAGLAQRRRPCRCRALRGK